MQKTKFAPHVETATELFSIKDGGYEKGRTTGGRQGWYTSSKKIVQSMAGYRKNSKANGGRMHGCNKNW